MSDFWSGMFVVGIIVLAMPFLLIALLALLFRKNNGRSNTSMLAIIVALLLIWIGDRFIVGFFCLPWECTRREIEIETLLLDVTDLPENFSIRDTYYYAYVSRASSAYIERIFHKGSKLVEGGFYQEIHQYRSLRGAAFQYEILRHDFPKQYVRIGTEPVLRPVKISDIHASQQISGYLYGSPNVCYYIGQYDEFIVILKMPFSGESVPFDDYIKAVQLADEKILSLLRN